MSEDIRADSYAPAYVRTTWAGNQQINANVSFSFPISTPLEIAGNVFEYVSSTQSLRIKQPGVFGFLVRVQGSASNLGDLGVSMRSNSPIHEWDMVMQPYYSHPTFIFATGGVRYVPVPAPCDYQVRLINTGGPGIFTVFYIDLRLTFMGRR